MASNGDCNGFAEKRAEIKKEYILSAHEPSLKRLAESCNVNYSVLRGWAGKTFPENNGLSWKQQRTIYHSKRQVDDMAVRSRKQAEEEGDKDDDLLFVMREAQAEMERTITVEAKDIRNEDDLANKKIRADVVKILNDAARAHSDSIHRIRTPGADVQEVVRMFVQASKDE